MTKYLEELHTDSRSVKTPAEHNATTGQWEMPTKQAANSTIKGALATVTTAGTRVRLSDYACHEITIIAKKANTGIIYVGGSDVASTVYGAALETKDSITLAVSNTNLIYLDSSVNGEGVSYVAI